MIVMNRLEYEYYEWLVSQIGVPKNNKTYNELFDRLNNVEFVWIVPKDDNRIQDALDLRYHFSEEVRDFLRSKGVSVLEVIVALSRRVAFIAGGNAPAWAWRLLKNLRLNRMSDPLSGANLDRIDNILYALIWREYRPDGQGGFFPLKDPREDQTKIEIWYQMNAYVIERN
jgi:hypothetical protein